MAEERDSTIMKRSIFTAIFLGIMIISYGQNYNPFLQNIGWCLEEYYGTGYIMQAYTNNGDTTIGNFNYSKLFKYNTLFLVREDVALRKVWVILPDSLSETLLYDFNISLGSQMVLYYVCNNPVLYTVDSFDSINTPLGMRQRIKLLTTDTVFHPNLYWIEGIGSSYGPIYLYDPTYSLDSMTGHSLICAYKEIGIQSYSGTCGMYCIEYTGSPCNSFIVGITETKNDNSKICIGILNQDLICIKSDKDKIHEIKVFTVEGKLLKRVYDVNKNKVLISTDDWDIGLYIIVVTLENGLKLIKKANK